MQIEIRRMNYDFHSIDNIQKESEFQILNNMFFNSKKEAPIKVVDTKHQDLELITKMNQELARSLDLTETLQDSLELIIKRINAQAANIFLIDEKKQIACAVDRPSRKPYCALCIQESKAASSLHFIRLAMIL